jgi:hypothetical protein
MKNAINPAVAGVVIAVIVVLALVFVGWSYLGPRTDGPSQPIDMGKMMGKDKVAPPSNRGGPMGMGTPK